MEEMERGRERGGEGCCPCALFAQTTPALSSAGRAFLFHPGDAMQSYVGIDIRRIASDERYELDDTIRDFLREKWVCDGKVAGSGLGGLWSCGFSQAGGGDNTKGVFCEGSGVLRMHWN